MELSLPIVSLIVFTQFVISFPIGFLILGNKIKFVPFIIKLPIYISLGLIIITIVLFVIGIVLVNQYILLAIGFVSYFLLFYKLFKNKHRFNVNFSKNWLRQNYVPIVSLVFFIMVFFHFSSVTGFMGWPPQGDIVNHGLVTSLIQHNEKLEATLTPLWPEVSVRAPQGLHVLATSNSSLFGIFPGESFFVMGTSILILIVLTAFSAAYILTRSLAFSSIAMAATFYIHPSGNLERWLMGYFYNGPYPNMYGYLILIIFIIFWFILPNNDRKDKKFLIMILSTIFGFLVVYPPFVILPVLFILIELMIKYLRNRNLEEKIRQIKQSLEFKKNSIQTHYLKGVALFIPAISLEISILSQLEENIQAVKGFSIYYHMPFNAYFLDYTYILVLLTLLLSCIFILKRKHIRISIFYFVFSSILVFSTQEIVFEQIWFLLTGRLFAFVHIFSWIMILFYTRELIRWKFNKDILRISSLISNQNISRLIIIMISVGVISILFLDPLISHATFEQAERLGWFPHTKSFQNDYDLLVWISKNIEPTELMMTDYSYTSKFIQSFSIKNVTASIWITSNFEIERAREGQSVWANPQLLPDYIQKYDIKYVVLNSEWAIRDNLKIGDVNAYRAKDHTIKEYGLFFSKFPFLEQVKEVGTSAVYKVLKPKLDEFLQQQEIIYDFSSGEGWKKIYNPDKFSLSIYDENKFSVKSTNASDEPLSLVHHFSDERNAVSLKDIMWLNLTVNATKPTQITLFLLDTMNEYYYYIKKIDGNELKTGMIENITIPLFLPDAVNGTPDLSQIERLQINLRSSDDDNLVTIHRLSFTGLVCGDILCSESLEQTQEQSASKVETTPSDPVKEKDVSLSDK